MVSSTLQAPPDNFVERVAATVALQKLAQNLFELSEYPEADRSGFLHNENRELRERFPSIERALGGRLSSDDTADYTAKEAAAQLGMIGADGDPTDAFYTRAQKELGAYKFGTRLRVPRANVDALRSAR